MSLEVQAYNSNVEITRRVKEGQLQELTKKLEELRPSQKARIESLIRSLNQTHGWGGTPDTDIFDQEMPYYALSAVQQGQITDHQFGSLMLYWNYYQEYKEHKGKERFDFPPYRVFDDKGEPIQKNIRLVFSTAGTSSTDSFNQEEEMRWIEEMKKLPHSEQQFFLTTSFKKEREMIDGLKRIRFSIFLCHQLGQEIIPTLGMMQAALIAKAGGNAVRIRPVLGISSLSDIRENGLTATRDMGVQFPGISLPEIADGYKAPYNQFSRHDFYHARIASLVPDDARKGIIKVSDICIENLQGLTQEQQRFCKAARNHLIDMEHVRFSPHSNLRESAFWITIQMSFYIAKRKVLAALNDRQYEAAIEETQNALIRKICKFLAETELPGTQGPQTQFQKVKEKFDQEKSNELLMCDLQRNWGSGKVFSDAEKALIAQKYETDIFDRMTVAWYEAQCPKS